MTLCSSFLSCSSIKSLFLFCEEETGFGFGLRNGHSRFTTRSSLTIDQTILEIGGRITTAPEEDLEYGRSYQAKLNSTATISVRLTCDP